MKVIEGFAPSVINASVPHVNYPHSAAKYPFTAESNGATEARVRVGVFIRSTTGPSQRGNKHTYNDDKHQK